MDGMLFSSRFHHIVHAHKTQAPQKRNAAAEKISPQTDINRWVNYSSFYIWANAVVNRFQA